MNWPSEDIKKTFRDIINDSKKLNSAQLETKYKTFKTDIEPLYNMAIHSVATNSVDKSLHKLDMMLNARESMNSGRTDKLTTDMLVGNQLGKEYIYPVVENPSSSDYKRAVDLIKKKDAIKEENDDEIIVTKVE